MSYLIHNMDLLEHIFPWLLQPQIISSGSSLYPFWHLQGSMCASSRPGHQLYIATSMGVVGISSTRPLSELPSSGASSTPTPQLARPPSELPSSGPFLTPTPQLSRPPSELPSSGPSLTPTIQPVRQPSSGPSSTPTIQQARLSSELPSTPLQCVSNAAPVPHATRVTTADVMNIMARLEQKVDMLLQESAKLTADNVTIRHDLVVCYHLFLLRVWKFLKLTWR